MPTISSIHLGQTPSSPYNIVTPTGSTSVATSLAQCVVAPGIVNPNTGTFQEKAPQPANVTTAPGSCYGFVVYRLGHMAFFRDNSEIQQPS